MLHRGITFRLTSLLVIAAFVAQLLAPAVAAAAAQERGDQALLAHLGQRLRAVAEAVCAKVSARDGNDVRVESFLCDRDHRVFMSVKGTLALSFPVLPDAWRQKMEDGAGTHVATNGSLALDFCVSKVERASGSGYRVTFEADVVLLLEDLARQLVTKAAATLGVATVGLAMSRLVSFFDAMDADMLGKALGDALHKIGVLVSGQCADDAYEVLERAGNAPVRELLSEGLTVRSVLYHCASFILKAGVQGGATLARLGLGAAMGCSLAGNVGVVVGGALAVVAVLILGTVLVDKLTRSLPMFLRLRSLRNLHARRLEAGAGTAEDGALLDEMSTVEDHLLEFVDRDLPRDRYEFFDELVTRLGDLAGRGPLGPYEGLIEKLRARLQASILQEDNWNAARKYWQLMEAIGRLPGGLAQPAAPVRSEAVVPGAVHVWPPLSALEAR